MQDGIDLELDEKLKKKYKNFIVFGFVGVIIQNRGLQHFIKLLPELNQTNIKVVIIGKGKLINTFKNFLKTHNCNEMVDWYDWVDFSKIATYINNFDVGITRLERNAQNDYTTANKLFQYMYLEKPVLTSDSLPMKRIVETLNTGIVFPSNDSKALKRAVIKLTEDAQLRIELGKNGRKAVIDIYNWENSSKELLNLYNNV